MSQISIHKRAIAESLGTAFLVTAVIGSGIMGERLAGGNVALALLANTLATGAALVALIMAFGGISGAHFNPAVTVGLFTARRIPAADLAPYIVAQLVGAIAAAAVLLLIARGKPEYSLAVNGLAANGYGEHSPRVR